MLKRHGDRFPTPCGDESGFGQVFDAVVPAFDINVRSRLFDDVERDFVFEYDDQADAFQCGQDACSIVLRVDRAVVAFAQHFYRRVGIDGDDQAASEFSGLSEISDVPAVQDVEDAVGHDNGFGQLGGSVCQLVERNDFLLESRRGQTCGHGRLR